ncbi:MAG: DMT family transporter [Thermodesulfobacteriota bacterium]|nr:DMT family transporter [Thermodesulfobacteriota bacterium]
MDISMSRDEVLGFASLICGVGLFSTVEISSKAIGARVDPVVLTFIRFFLTGIVLMALSVPILRLRLEPLGLRDYGIFCLNGFIGITLSITIFHIAVLVFEKAASCAVVFSANPVFVVIIARFVNNEAWNLRKWVGVLTGAMGVSCFAWESGQLTISSLHGLGLMLLSAFLFALSVCITKRVIANYGAIVLMGFSALFGSLFLLPLVFVRLFCEGLGGLAETWVLVLYVSLVGTALAYGFYYFGLLNTSAYKGSMTFFLKPVLASLLAAMILHETINAYMVVGTTLILSGLFVSVMKPRKPLGLSPEQSVPGGSNS